MQRQLAKTGAICDNNLPAASLTAKKQKKRLPGDYAAVRLGNPYNTTQHN